MKYMHLYLIPNRFLLFISVIYTIGEYILIEGTVVVVIVL